MQLDSVQTSKELLGPRPGSIDLPRTCLVFVEAGAANLIAAAGALASSDSRVLIVDTGSKARRSMGSADEIIDAVVAVAPRAEPGHAPEQERRRIDLCRNLLRRS